MSSRRPTVTIVEEPAGKQQRFRYASEVDGTRSVGSIPGVNSRPDRKTYPTIRVSGYQGPMLVMLSLVNPHDNRCHPHAITGNDPRYQCRHGVIYAVADGPEVVFNNIGVLCVKSKTNKDVRTALQNRQEVNLDPLNAGFDHIYDHSLIDFNAVRLCFSVFLPGPGFRPEHRDQLKSYTIELKPVVSEIVYDAKKLSDLRIIYMNNVAGSIMGGTEMILLCEKYTGTNPEVVFADGTGWERKAHVKMHHKQVAVVFETPPYRDTSCLTHVQVEVYLQRPGKGSGQELPERSLPVLVEYIPLQPQAPPSGIKRPPPYYLENKRKKLPLAKEDDYSKYLTSSPTPTPARYDNMPFAVIPPPYKQELMDTAGSTQIATSSNLEKDTKLFTWEQPSPPMASFLEQQGYAQRRVTVNDPNSEMSINKGAIQENIVYESPSSGNPTQNATFDLDYLNHLIGKETISTNVNNKLQNASNTNRLASNDNQAFHINVSPQKTEQDLLNPYLLNKLEKDIFLDQSDMAASAWGDIQKNLENMMASPTDMSTMPMSPESVGSVMSTNPFSPLPNVVPTAPSTYAVDPDIVPHFNSPEEKNNRHSVGTNTIFPYETTLKDDFDELDFDCQLKDANEILRKMAANDEAKCSANSFVSQDALSSAKVPNFFYQHNRMLSNQHDFASSNCESSTLTIETEIMIPGSINGLTQNPAGYQPPGDRPTDLFTKYPTPVENYPVNLEDEAEKLSGELEQFHLF